jgi:uncharacterized repeat protein (TIGR01451 family)
MKRLLVRLSLLSLLVAVGVFAIVQAQQERGPDPSPGEAKAEAGKSSPSPLLAPPSLAQGQARDSASAASFRNATSQLIPLPAEFAESPGERPFVMPAPTPAIVRGNNGDDSPETTPAEPPPANLLAQAGSSRARNPFARRSVANQTTGNASQALTPEPDPATNAAPAETTSSTEDGAFRVSGPALAAPNGADATSKPQQGEYQSDHAAAYTADATAAATQEKQTSASEYTGYQEISAATGDAKTPPALGAPRELPAYGGAASESDGAGYQPARPLAAQGGREQEFGVRRQEAGIRNQEASVAPERGEDADVAPQYGANPTYGQAPSTSAGQYAASASPAGGIQGAGVPGPQSLEGAQTPSITLKKIAPPEIQVGKPATFEIHVQNVGQVAAHQVIVKEDIPRGVRLMDTAPPADTRGTSLLWELGTLQPGDSRQIKVQYLPMTEGDIGSVAVAAFQAQASVRTVCTRPQLAVEQAAPERVLIGQSFTVRIRLSNPGTGVATKVVLEEDVPEGFRHPSGQALEYEVGSLRPGESRDLDLTLQAAKPGVWDNMLVVRGEGNLAVEKSVQVEIVAPQLDLAMAGPTRRYLERQATYAVSIANPGTATAQDVKIVGRLPKGMKFVAANNEGQYDPKTHAVVWALAELPPGQRGEVQLTTLPVETGEQKIVVEGKGDLDVAAQAEQAVTVEALAELAFEIADKADPIEVDGETLYEVKVTNKGSKTATNIRLTAIFPSDMKPTAGDGPARADVADRQVVFEPLARLNPREQAVFRIQAQGLKPGDQRIQVQIVSDDSPTPVTKEESTRVYADQ